MTKLYPTAGLTLEALLQVLYSIHAAISENTRKLEAGPLYGQPFQYQYIVPPAPQPQPTPTSR